MNEKDFFRRLNRQWRNKGPKGSDKIQTFVKCDNPYDENPLGTLHSAVIRTAEKTRYVEHLRAVIYNPRTDEIITFSDHGYDGMITEIHIGENAEVDLELTNRVITLPPAIRNLKPAL